MSEPTWKRTPYGYLRSDGAAFLERGGQMSDTGTNAWLVWLRVPAEAVEIDYLSDGSEVLIPRSTGMDTVSRLSGHLMLNDEVPAWADPEALYIHRFDTGWLSEAKAIVAAETKES